MGCTDGKKSLPIRNVARKSRITAFVFGCDTSHSTKMPSTIASSGREKPSPWHRKYSVLRPETGCVKGARA